MVHCWHSPESALVVGLQDTRTASEARRRREDVIQGFKTVSDAVYDVLEVHGIAPAAAKLLPLQDWFIHGVTLVDSRALTIHGRKYLVPFADMFNYEPHAVGWAWGVRREAWGVRSGL